jgi:hypothetical protein
MKTLASHIERELESGDWAHCAIYEADLQRLWPLNERNREAKIAQFAKKYGFRLRFYTEGLCAIFDRPTAVKATSGRTLFDQKLKDESGTSDGTGTRRGRARNIDAQIGPFSLFSCSQRVASQRVKETVEHRGQAMGSITGI